MYVELHAYIGRVIKEKYGRLIERAGAALEGGAVTHGAVLQWLDSGRPACAIFLFLNRSLT